MDHVNLLVDTDVGIDDAQAMVLALSQPNCTIHAVTCVGGNAKLENVIKNVGTVLQVCERQDIPYYAGCALPLVAGPLNAEEIHGVDGLGGVREQFSKEEKSNLGPFPAIQEEHAVNALVRLAREKPGYFTLVTLGPLTNIAMACRLDPLFPANIKKIVVMGGTIEAFGNATMSAEFNFMVDPEAAHVVLDCFEKVQILSWETTWHFRLPWPSVDKWMSGLTLIGRFIARISEAANLDIRQSVREGLFIPDPLAMAVAIDPSLVLEQTEHFATMELKGTHTRGMMVVERRAKFSNPYSHKYNVVVIRVVDMPRVLNMLFESVGLPPSPPLQ
eukprot:GCRY01003866.1.p1 GENE.GCRY01003866.1~~GCRY01003866.1.p1  ORF type:complete len:331 (+),score=91.20 GCRY01003866.1:86-1078(+)